MVRYVQERKEQLRVAMACHIDPTSGHMREKKTIARIRERFAWKGIIKDVQQMVSFDLQCAQEFDYFILGIYM